MLAPEPRWVWIDLEMTGLDPLRCVILEAAVVLTTPDLAEVASFETVVSAAEEDLSAMQDVVREMHTRSGLLSRVRSSTTTLAGAEAAMLELLRRHCPQGTGILCGNSVWQDRRFLERYMPAFLAHLHYRIVDVSSLKVLVEAWKPQAALDKGESAHTAMADIRASIEELRHYRRMLF